MNNSNSILADRSQFTARQSIDSLIAYARVQDEKIVTRKTRLSSGKGIAVFALLFIPVTYVVHSLTVGFWRRLYTTSFVTTPIESVSTNVREYFVPEIYLKEREIRKIELNQLALGLKNL